MQIAGGGEGNGHSQTEVGFNKHFKPMGWPYNETIEVAGPVCVNLANFFMQ